MTAVFVNMQISDVWSKLFQFRIDCRASRLASQSNSDFFSLKAVMIWCLGAVVSFLLSLLASSKDSKPRLICLYHTPSWFSPAPTSSHEWYILTCLAWTEQGPYGKSAPTPASGPPPTPECTTGLAVTKQCITHALPHLLFFQLVQVWSTPSPTTYAYKEITA